MSRLPSLLLLLAACGSEAVISSIGNVDDRPVAPDEPEDLVPPIAVCQAQPNPARPGEAVRFVGENSYDPDGIPLLSYRWQLVRKPEASRARLPGGQANIDDFVPDAVGEYTALLTVINENGRTSDPCDAAVTVKPSERLYIEMLTEFPRDDMELALVRGEDWPSTDLCSQTSCSVDWGAPGDASDDPVLVSEDVDEEPEVIVIEDPSTGIYTVRVFDRPEALWLADHDVTVVVYVDGVEKWRGTKTFEEEAQIEGFVRIAWPSAQFTPL